jgi:hypothetical protein
MVVDDDDDDDGLLYEDGGRILPVTGRATKLGDPTVGSFSGRRRNIAPELSFEYE